MKPLIIGEAPSKRGDSVTPCGGRIGRRLAACFAIPYDDYLERFERINLLGAYPGADGKGAKFEAREAAQAADALTLRGRVVLVLGQRAAKALGLRAEYCTWQDHRGGLCAVIPHPSGINRWYNDAANVESLMIFLQTVPESL